MAVFLSKWGESGERIAGQEKRVKDELRNPLISLEPMGRFELPTC